MMDIRALAFDVNGTLVDIVTDEGMEEIYRSLRHFLIYQGIDIPRGELRELYFRLVKEQLQSSHEQYPEYDPVGIWRTIVDERKTDFTRNLPSAKLEQMPLFLAEMYRGLSRKRLQLYPNLLEVLEKLRSRFPMALVTDAQAAYARAELHKVGIAEYFHPIIVSGECGYRKPDARMFRKALEGMGTAAEHTLFIGNDMFRDIYGAQQVGMKAVMYNSTQGDKSHPGVKPDFAINDHRELFNILGITDV